MKKGDIIICIFLCVLLISCVEKNQEETGNTEIKLALMVKRADIRWYQLQIKGFEETCKSKGIQYLILDNKMDSNLTLTNIDTLISRKVNGVAIAITEQKMSWIVVSRFFEAGIPIISLNYKLVDKQGRQLSPHIGIDYYEAGVKSGNWLAENIISHALIADPGITPGIAELDSESVMEVKTWTDTIKKRLLSQIEGLSSAIFFRVDSPVNDAAGAMLAMQELLSTHPDITNWIVYAGSSDEMTGALRALDQVGMRDYSCALSIECAAVYKNQTRSDSDKEAIISVNTYEQGKQAAELLYEYIKFGTPIPSITLSSYDLLQ